MSCVEASVSSERPRHTEARVPYAVEGIIIGMIWQFLACECEQERILRVCDMLVGYGHNFLYLPTFCTGL